MSGRTLFYVAAGLVIVAILWFSAWSTDRFEEECQAAGGTVHKITRDMLCVDSEGRILPVRRRP